MLYPGCPLFNLSIKLDLFPLFITLVSNFFFTQEEEIVCLTSFYYPFSVVAVASKLWSTKLGGLMISISVYRKQINVNCST